MLELGILCIIALAAIYWMTMWLVGRHEDVLYGSFVTPTPGAAGSETLEPDRELPPELPRRPRVARPEPAPDMFAREKPVLAERRPTLPVPSSAPLQRNRPEAEPTPPQRNEMLASLLETIKRDLGEVSRR
ncbi:hypothetical protein [Rhodopseudomonas telluris]|uniref:Uncharacterized protein n=1 Tax=Rhodopseudomonas telluris TaxID=644215 RepID=A0ABV6ELC1_9BRAD